MNIVGTPSSRLHTPLFLVQWFCLNKNMCHVVFLEQTHKIWGRSMGFHGDLLADRVPVLVG